MTDKGMAAINKALTVVEKVPTTFSESPDAVPTSTIMIMQFMLQIAKHASENKVLICKMIKDDERLKSLHLTDEMTISVYLMHVVTRASEMFSHISRTPIGYPPERLVKLISDQLEEHNATIAKHGLAPV